jgi:starvation-inducible outer membrane lipoprotein
MIEKSPKGGVDDSLLALLEKGKIDKWEYDYKWLEADLYKNIWHLIRDNNRLITVNLAENWG